MQCTPRGRARMPNAPFTCAADTLCPVRHGLCTMHRAAHRAECSTALTRRIGICAAAVAARASCQGWQCV